MANRRELVKRRKAVRNIRKITRTMQLIATARYQAALSRATASKPYTEKLAELVRDIAGAAERIDHPLMQTPEDSTRSALVVLTSMRGLCGGYNANVLRTAIEHLDNQQKLGTDVDVYVVGKKGIGYFRFLKRPMHERITNIGDVPKFETVEPIANGLMDRFIRGEVGSIHVAYMRFHSPSKQRPELLQLLPLKQEAASAEQGEPKAQSDGVGVASQYEFSPEPQSLLNELLPATVRIRLFQCFNDAAVSEQIARMVAMKAATDAAGDMITSITRQYNRARQPQITIELFDIVAGANALS